MASTIIFALKNGRNLVTLADVQRGDKGLSCFACQGDLVVKDGKGRFVKVEGRQFRPRGKHFSHKGNGNGCHGEGTLHSWVKWRIYEAINFAITMRRDNRNMRGTIRYRCPNPEYEPFDLFKDDSEFDGQQSRFPELRYGYHFYDLLGDYPSTPTLEAADCEKWLDDGTNRTRPDIVGVAKDGSALWAIEVKRTHLSQNSIAYAKHNALALFVVDIGNWPELGSKDFSSQWMAYIFWDNLRRGFLPLVNESYATVCQRQALGMGATDTRWHSYTEPVHQGNPEECRGLNCPGCQMVEVHACGVMFCEWERERMLGHQNPHSA